MFKRLMNPELRGVRGARDEVKQITDEAPATKAAPLVIIRDLPGSGQPLTTVPPKRAGQPAAVLPSDGGCTAVVGKHLILRDVDANVVVDYVSERDPVNAGETVHAARAQCSLNPVRRR